MTREEAIQILNEKAYFLYEDTYPYERIAFDMAIESLSAEPSISIEQRELCEDINCEDCPFMQDTCKLLEVFKEFYEQGKYDATIEKPSGDLISRQEAIKSVMAEGRNVHASEYANAERIIHEADAIEVLAMLPSAVCDDCIWRVCNYNSVDWEKPSADRPRGEWKWTHGGQCSECGFHNTNFDFNFCPNCGANMRKE